MADVDPTDQRAMKRPPTRREEDALEPVERHLSRGDWRGALHTLLRELDLRAGKGDRAAALTVRLLRAQDTSPPTPDAMAAALDRLVVLVERQEAQIRALRALLDERL